MPGLTTSAGAAYNLGVLLTELDPPELVEARRWYTQAAQSGDAGAAYNLGVLLAYRLDPPELVEARHWYTQAAQAGNAGAAKALAQLHP
jgi:TPR repeat protein